MSIIQQASDRLSQADSVVIDVETNGLDWRTCVICGYVLTFGPREEDSLYLPVRHETGPNLSAYRVWEMLLFHQNRPRHWVGHNLAFDLSFLHAADLKLNGTFEDTMINAALIDEFRRSFSLESCAEEAGVQAKKSTEILDHIANTFNLKHSKSLMGSYWRLPADDKMAVAYARGDGTTTWQLWMTQQEKIREQELETVHKVECDLIPVLNSMTMRGIRVDQTRLNKLHDVMGKIKKEAHAAIGGINVNSSQQIKKYLTDEGVSGWPTTPAGNPSFAEEYLSTIEPGKKILAVRKATRFLDAFIDPMINRHLYKGRVHSSFNQLKSDSFGTVTGRLSSSNPNLQQVPKRDKEIGILFRSIFLPDEGMEWGSADYSQCEPRLLAHYSRCKVLVDGYTKQPSVDAHTAVANAAGIDRQSGKRLNQALLTGAGSRKAASMLGKPMAEAEAIVEAYFKAMPEIRDLQAMASAVMRKRGYVRSILNRRSRLEGHGYEYKAVNRLLQCSNADMIKSSMVKLDELHSIHGGIHMLNNVHDSLDFQFFPDKRPIYQESLRIMCDFPQLRVPIEVDEDTGPDWAWASYGEEDWKKYMTKHEMI